MNQHPGGGQPLWDGGTVTIPARISGALSCTPNQFLAGLAARLQAPRPSCDSGTVTLTVAVAARNSGPSATAANYAGSLRIHRMDTGARLADSGSALGSMPANTTRTLTATAVSVPAALLAAGQIVVALDVETWDQTGNTGAAWLLSNFTASYEFQQEGCETQFLRRIVTDCETGETLSVTDTTLDGEPYTVTGEVGQCTATGGGSAARPPPEARVDVETGELCLVDDASGDVIGRVLVERVYDDQTGERTTQRLVDPVTGDAVTVPAGASLAVCPQEPEQEPCRNTSTLLVCDLPTGGTPTPTVTGTDPSAYVGGPPTIPVPGGAPALWSGGSVTIGRIRRLALTRRAWCGPWRRPCRPPARTVTPAPRT
ncbi:hypothetical protein ACR6C2_07690 [Streptomyces sp. INA 01156]